MQSQSLGDFWMLLIVALALFLGAVHCVASAVGFYRLRAYPDISKSLFSLPVQIPVSVGLLRIRFYWPRSLPDLTTAEDAKAVGWLRAAQMSGSALIIAFLALLALGIPLAAERHS